LADFIQFGLVASLSRNLGFDKIFYLSSILCGIVILIVIFYDFETEWERKVRNRGDDRR
jgi:hypothetical protein